MKHFLLYLVGLFFCGLSVGAKTLSTPPTLSTDASPVYYVIMNQSFGTYLVYNGYNRNRPKLLSSSSIDDNALWYFVGANGSTQAQDGCYFASLGAVNETHAYVSNTFEGPYLSSARQYNSNLAFFSQASSDAIWYVHKNPYDAAGCVISTTAGTPTTGTANCWYYDRIALIGEDNYFIKLGSLENQDYYKYVFLSYEDLLDVAADLGIDTSAYESADRTKGDSFKSLIQAIETTKAAASMPTIDDGSYLIRNRRSGLYLNTNGTAMAGVSSPTQYSVWRLTTVGGVKMLVSLDNAGQVVRVSNNDRRGDNAEAYWMLTGDQSYSVTFEKSSDGDARYVKMSYTFTASSGTGNRNPVVYFSMKTADKSIYSTLTSGITSDWEFIPVSEYAYTVDNSITDEAELLAADESAAHAPFFRLRNVGRDVSDYVEDQYDGGGWLEDVDHTHFEYRLSETSSSAFGWEQTEAQLMYNAKDADFYAAMPNATHASALWQFELIGRASAAGESATGLISPEHNIYILKNANTGKYLGKEVQSVGDVSVIKEKTKKSQAVPFYLEKLFDGQYVLRVYSGTTSGVDATDGIIAIGGTTAGYQGAATKGGTPTAQEAVNTSQAWIIMPAPTLELQFLNIATTDGYSWSTFFYPFDVAVGTVADGQTVNLYQGGWQSTPNYNSDGSVNKWGIIAMNEVSDVPAGNPVFVRSTKNGDEPYGNILLNIYPAGTMDAQTETSAFADNVWKGVVESEGHYFGDDWRSYWVLTRGSSGEAKLLHPAGNYLLPNRAYIDSETTERQNINISQLKMVFPGDNTTAITTIETSQNNASGIYDLQGRKLDARAQLSKGIYIINGKKVIIK